MATSSRSTYSFYQPVSRVIFKLVASLLIAIILHACETHGFLNLNPEENDAQTNSKGSGLRPLGGPPPETVSKPPVHQFSELTNLRTFVDKTLFIKHFFINGPDNIIIIAPRFFSKSTNLNMLKTFFEMEIGPDGSKVEQNMTQNCRVFADKNLKIFQDPEFFKANCAKYPVMHLDFGEIDATTREDFYVSFNHLIRKIYEKFAYLSKSKRIPKSELKALNDVLELEEDDFLDVPVLMRTGKQLAELIFKHHGERVILLIDNYDTPIKQAIMSKAIDEDETTDIVEFLTLFIDKIISKKDHVFKSLFTGCLTAGEVYLQENNNNTRIVSIFRDLALSSFYGFQEADVEDLLKKFGKKAEEIDELRTWYGGYYVEGSHKLLFNPNSILRYLKTGKLKGYFELSEDLKALEPFFDFDMVGEMGEGLLGTDIMVLPHGTESMEKLLFLKSMFCDDEWYVLYLHRMIQFFMELGYYTSYRRIPNPVVGDAVNIAHPNTETREDFRKLVFTPVFYKTKFNVSDEHVGGFIRSIEGLSPERATFVAFASAVERVFHWRKPRDVDELVTVLRALVVVGRRLPYVDREGNTLLVKRNDSVGVVVGAAFVKSSGKMVLSRILESRVYEKVKKEVKTVILIGLFMDSIGQCDVEYVYDKFDLAERQSAVAPRTPPPPTTTTTAAPRFTWPTRRGYSQ
nr:PREDICTED: uncharacterized protein LOC109033412 [Bemisia tabaci]